ncbi:MAG: hypothetical protein IKV87_04115 [Methanobrevibacter sp.]|nr:hypothetical protein [Methanobrevibacter sp.]
MDGDFFQLLRRIQKEERNKSTLARVENDFYKQLYSYIRALERSVAKNPFDNSQSILLNNAQRIATEICELRESKISKAANNNIYRSFHLFKKENPQFDLIDTTPLNLTDEEETLYFSLMDALKTHRYNISLDKIGEEKSNLSSSDYEDEDEDEDYGEGYEDDDRILESRVNPGVVSEEEFFNDGAANESDLTDGFSGESVSVDEVVESAVDEPVVDAPVVEKSVMDEPSVDESVVAVPSTDDSTVGIENEVSVDSSLLEPVIEESNAESAAGTYESDEVLERLNQIKNSTVVEDEKYEPIEKQIHNQAKVVPNVPMSNNLQYDGKKSDNKEDVASDFIPEESKTIQDESEPIKTEPKSAVKKEVKPIEDRPKRKSSSTLDFDSIFSNPDSQFDDVSAFEHDYEADFANVQASSAFAEPSEADLMFSLKSKPKSEVKPKSQVETKPKVPVSESKSLEHKVPVSESKSLEPKVPVSEPEGLEAKEQEQKSKSIKGLAKKEELENTAVVIYKDMGSFMGIDQKVYGPFLANDVVILPNITAKILIDNNKAGLIDI